MGISGGNMKLSDVIKFSPDWWTLLGEAVCNAIRKRVRSKNQNADGEAFADYSDGYSKLKAAGDVSVRGRGVSQASYSTTPDMTLTGKTLDDLSVGRVGKDYVDTLYEIMAYCCYSWYPIQLLFCFVGTGRNGKSQFLKILEKFVGGTNTTTTELDLLMSNRFETFKLYKKLVALMGETDYTILNKSSMLKKITLIKF